MGYTLGIGEAEMDFDADSKYLEITFKVEFEDTVKAPDGLGGNWRDAGYGYFKDVANDLGLTELFFGQGWDRSLREYSPCSGEFHREFPLIQKHPGHQVIGLDDVDHVTSARIFWEDHRAVSGLTDPPGLGDDKDDRYFWVLWLEFWMAWAVHKCERPIFYNR